MITQARVIAIACVWMTGLAACSADSSSEGTQMGGNPVAPPVTSLAAGSGPSSGAAGSTAARPPTTPTTPTTGSATPPMTPSAPTPGAAGRGSTPSAPPPPAGMMPAPMAPPPAGMMPAPMTPPPAGGPVMAPPPPSGDPNGSGANVSITETRCGPAAGLDVFVAGTGIPGPGTPNVKIGGRDVVLSYPCNIKEGAHVTFILNLHGTMPDETLKTYQHGYFSAHKLVDSHKLIVATPISKSPVGQWGNMDGGVDVPHLHEVIKWVYDKFNKLQITGMWVGGHSWGSAFAKTFVCDAMLKDKVRGVIGMSGGATAAGGLGGGDCAARISQIHTNGELEGGEAGVPNQTAIAAAHGCDAAMPKKDIGNGQILYDWPNCDKGWVHFNFVMGAHEHITAIDDPVVKYIVDAIKSTEM